MIPLQHPKNFGTPIKPPPLPVKIDMSLIMLIKYFRRVDGDLHQLTLVHVFHDEKQDADTDIAINHHIMKVDSLDPIILCSP